MVHFLATFPNLNLIIYPNYLQKAPEVAEVVAVVPSMTVFQMLIAQDLAHLDQDQSKFFVKQV